MQVELTDEEIRLIWDIIIERRDSDWSSELDDLQRKLSNYLIDP
jgi:hypothetical protein